MKTSDYSALMPDYGIFRELCLACGPSGFEDEPDAIINKALSGFCDRVEQDPLGNTLAYIGNDPGKKTLMLFAHKDEVGFLVTGITPEGLVRFENIGGIDVSVLCGRRVVLDTLDGRRIPGIISMRPVHVLSRDERNKMPSHDDLYIDVGATDRAQLDGILAAGCPGTFSPSFSFFGEDGRMLAAKAIDDRLGCAVLLELARHFSENRDALDANLVLAFTVREEIGVSGANTAAHPILHWCWRVRQPPILQACRKDSVSPAPERAEPFPLWTAAPSTTGISCVLLWSSPRKKEFAHS